MKIDLTKIPCFLLTCEKYQDRWPKVQSYLDDLGITAKFIVGEITNPYTIGVARGHLDALRESSGNGPVLLIEDDFVPLGPWRDIIEVPENADCLYLGTSLFYRQEGETKMGKVPKDDLGDFFKISGMLSLHCVLYISEKYKKHVIDLLENFDTIGGVDDRISETQENFMALAVKKSWAAQDDGHSYWATSTDLY